MGESHFPSCYEEALALAIVQSHDLTKMNPAAVHDLFLRTYHEICEDKKVQIKKGVFFARDGKLKT